MRGWADGQGWPEGLPAGQGTRPSWRSARGGSGRGGCRRRVAVLAISVAAVTSALTGELPGGKPAG